MQKLKLWMRIVGGFYLFLGLFNTPPVVAARMTLQYPMLDLALDHVAVKAINDLWFLFGVETAVIGLMLLVASARPQQNRVLVQTVLLLELTRGVLVDLYWISRGYYDNLPFIVWLVIHLAIIVTGWRLLQRTKAIPALTAS